MAKEMPSKMVDFTTRMERALANVPEDKKNNLTPRVNKSIQRTIEMISQEDIGPLDPDYILRQILREYDLIEE